MKNKLLILIAMSLFLHSCFDTSLEFENQFEPVLEAYLYQGRPVENIKITSMYSFGSDTTLGGQKIIDADVRLRRGEEVWQLVHNYDDSGTYYLDEDIDLFAEDTFEILVDLNDGFLSAKTIVPQIPPEINMSATRLVIPEVDDMMEFREMEMPDPIEFTWENSALKYYFFRVQNIETYDDPIMPEPPNDRPFKIGGFNFQMDSRPINDNYFSLSPRELTNYGTHRIIVYSVNAEYVALYNSIDQDSKELNEPYTNVENGLGIFTAFSSDTLFLEVVPE